MTDMPGPWQEYDCDTEGTPARGHLAGDIWGVGRDGQAAIVARVYYCEDGSEANARLIAAAPELLAALSVALTADECPCCGRDNTGHDRCTSDDCPGVQAIAKATNGQEEEERNA
jgi:hypothetical protein